MHTVFTVGHSMRPIEEFVALLEGHAVSRLIDVRTVPRSARNPQFAQDALPGSLAAHGIGYEHFPGLGGFRKPRPDSPNDGWRNLNFRGYADYMLTDAFRHDLERIIEKASGERLALMCAEAVPWRCHRSLIADALTVRGLRVEEIAGPARTQVHKLTPFARVDESELTYPPDR